MKIVFFTHGGYLYGANLSMIELIVGLRELATECLVVHSEDGPIRERLNELGIPSVCAPFDGTVHWKSKNSKLHPRRWLSEAANLCRAIKKHIHNKFRIQQLSKIAADFQATAIVSNASGTIIGLPVARQLGLPHIWHIREFGDLDWDFYPDFGFKARRRQMLQSSHVIFITEPVARHHQQQCSLIGQSNHHILHNAVADTLEYERRADLVASKAKQDSKFQFVIAGYVKFSKGQFDAVTALQHVIKQGFDVQLAVAGQGATEDLAKHATALGISSHVKILGHVDDLSHLYLESDCGLMCSAFEAFGRVTVEYMSWGLPVIGRNTAGTAEIITNGQDGLFYDGSIEDLAEKMVEIIENPERRDFISKNGFITVRERYERGRYSRQFLDICNQPINCNE